MLNKTAELTTTLHVLKRGRVEMVQDFLTHRPEIYTPSYKYENSPVLLKLSIEKYFIAWLSSHWQIFNIIAKHFLHNERRYSEMNFSLAFLQLLSKWNIVKIIDSSHLTVGLKLIQDMEVALHEFIKVGDKTDETRNRLETILEKNNVVFDRLIKQLNENKL